MEKSEYEIRKERLLALRTQSGEAYPVDVARTHEVGDFLAQFDDLVATSKFVVLTGRVIASRRIGVLAFLRLRDASGDVQLVVRKEDLGDAYDAWFALFDTGDIVEATGSAYVTKTGEQSLLVTRVRQLAKALRPLPEKWHGLQDIEVRYRQRELDLIANPDVRERFVMRSRLVSAFRRFLDGNGFLEVETPMLQAIPGGANAKPFITHHNALGSDLYMRIAPELYLKRLLVGGFEKIYEIGRCFRNEGIDYAHNPEFTMMEMYWAYVNPQVYISFLEDLLRDAIRTARGGDGKVTIEDVVVDFDAPWEKVTFTDAILRVTGIDVRAYATPDELVAVVREKKIPVDFKGSVGMAEHLDALYKATARPLFIQPTWVFDYPLSLKPLARQHPTDPSSSASTQLVVCGAEIVNAYYHELNDPEDQRARFEAQQDLREQGSEEAQWMDEEFLSALELGMPPASGVGIGIDRLAAMITGSHNLKEIILFPTLKPKETSVPRSVPVQERASDVLSAIRAKLDTAGVVYRATEHGPLPEDSDVSLGYAAADRPHHSGAKAIVIKGKKTKSFYHFTLPDDCKLDQKKVEAVIGEKWSFASGDEVLAVTGCVPGSVPPFGSVLGMRTHMDKRLRENSEIFFNAGSLTHSLALHPDDYVRVESPEEVDIAE